MPDAEEDEAVLLIIAAWSAWVAAVACWVGALG